MREKSEHEQNSTEQVLRRPNSASLGTPAGASSRKVAIPTKYSNQIHQSGHTKPNIQTKFTNRQVDDFFSSSSTFL
jgi:hypothetical protein